MLWSEYRITIPDILYYKMIALGYLPMTVYETKPINFTLGQSPMQATYYRFAIKDAPAFAKEPYITTASDYVSKIDFELAKVDWPGSLVKNFSVEWSDLNKTLLDNESFGGQIKRTGFLKDVASQIKAASADTLERLNAAVKYITSTIKWDGKASMYCENAKKIVEKKEGDAGDINLVLVDLLREMDYDVHPVILSTRSHGRVNQSYALIKQFNYVVACMQVNGKDFLIDATDPFLKVGMLPVNCLNKVGYLIHPTEHRFVPIKPTELDREYENANLSISEDGELTGTFLKTYGGYSGWSAKTNFKSEGKEKFLEGVKKGKPNWEITKAEYGNYDDLNASMSAQYELAMSDYVTKAGNMMYLKPMLSEGFTTNPLKAENRLFPLDYGYLIEETFSGNYQLPAGYTAVEVPKSAVISLPNNGGRFSYSVTSTGSKVSVSSKVQFRKTEYAAEEYEHLKEFYNQIIAKHNEQIVLKKTL